MEEALKWLIGKTYLPHVSDHREITANELSHSELYRRIDIAVESEVVHPRPIWWELGINPMYMGKTIHLGASA